MWKILQKIHFIIFRGGGPASSIMSFLSSLLCYEPVMICVKGVEATLDVINTYIKNKKAVRMLTTV